MITARLRLNYDPIKALSEISSARDQVRGDMPPEAEIPVINVESADSQFASAYLSFTSDVLQQNEITDYLVSTYILMLLDSRIRTKRISPDARDRISKRERRE